MVVYGEEYFFGGSGIESCPPVSCWLELTQDVLAGRYRHSRGPFHL